MRKIYLLLLFQFFIMISKAQIVASDTVCVNTQVSFTTNVKGNLYTWSFDTINTNSTITTTANPKKVVMNNTNMQGGISPVVYDSAAQKYFAFWGNWNGNATIYRMDFGSNPLSTPTVTTVSIAGMGFSGTDNGGMDVVMDDVTGNWYLFWAGKSTTSSQLLRVNFGNSLANTPTGGATISYGFTQPTTGYTFQLSVKKYNNEWLIFAASNWGAVARLDFGASLTNMTPTLTALPTPVSIDKAGYFSLYQQSGSWYMTLVTTTTSKSYRYEFGTDLKNNTPTLVTTTNTGGTMKGVILFPNQQCRNQLFGYGIDEGARLTKFDYQGSITTAPTIASMGTFFSGRPVTIGSAVYNDTVYAVVTEFNNRNFVAVPLFPLPAGSIIKHYDPAITRTYTTPGVYTVTLMVDPGSPAGASTFCKEIVVKSGTAPNIPAPFIDSSANVCVSQTGVRYEIPAVPGATGYSWSYTGTGATINGSGTSVTVDFSSTATGGMLRVSAISVGLCGSAPGLPREMRVIVNTLPVATITPSGTATFCQGRNMKLKANGGTNFLRYQWKQGAGNVGTNDSDYYATAGGSYTVVVTNTTTRCSNTSAAVVLTANPSPTATIVASGPLTFCNRDSVVLNASPKAAGNSYLWLYNNVPGATIDTIHAFNAGAYRVVVTNSFNCKDTSAVSNITVRPLPAAVITPQGNTSICLGDHVVLQANTGTGLLYDWRRGNNSVGINAAYTADVAGSYKVIVTDANNCKDSSAPVTVNVYTVPAVQITPDDTAFCKGGYVTLRATSSATGLAYQWKKDGNPIPTATVAFYEAITSGTYLVEVQVPSVSGCKDTSVPVHVTVHSLPQPVILWDGTSLRADSTYTSYKWYLDAVLLLNAVQNSFTPTEPGTYTLVVTNDNGCENISNTYNLYRTPTGLTNIAPADGDVKIYPNPVTSILHIAAPDPMNVTIFTLDGREVLHRVQAKDIDISGLVNGMYLVRIATDENITVKTERIIKAASW